MLFVCFVIFVCFVFSSCANRQAATDIKQPADGPDKILQRAATEALGDREGVVIVIDPQTGRLRAVVNPRLAFEQNFPPGSAIKPFTAFAALRSGLVEPGMRHVCRSRYSDAGFQIVCSHPKNNLAFDLAQALAYSCNDYFARVGERLSEGSFNATLNGFGFGIRTGVNASEAAGSLPHGDWHVRDALGESEDLLVTPVQLITAYSALVNGGRLYRPHLSGDRQVVPREAARLNITPLHRETLIEGMRGAVRYGTAKTAMLAELPFYVFGKTGTSTSSNGFRTQGWFIGFAAGSGAQALPRADRIKLGVLVFLKRGHGLQCAEVARRILECGMRIGEWGECGMRNAECGMRNAECGVNGLPDKEVYMINEASRTAIFIPHSAFRIPHSIHSAFRIPHSVRVRAISENITRDIPLEEYLVGVLAGESSVENAFEALKAQAVISRTFAIKNPGRHAREGFDFCSTTHCQRFVIPKPGPRSARRAVEATHGQVLKDDAGEPIEAYFHAACGGMTANIESLWGVIAPAYLRGVRDDFCASMPHRRWRQAIQASQLNKALQSDERTDVGARLNSIKVNKRDRSGRAESITLEGARRRDVRGWDFKIIVGRSLGWQFIKSSWFDVSRSEGNYVFNGHGFGHGLGLCQEGAHVMARRGMNYQRILDHYFPGTRLTTTQALSPGFSGAFLPVTYTEGSNKQLLSSEHFRISFARGNDRAQVGNAARTLEVAFDDLQQRLEKASLRLPENSPIEITIYSTTADFIAATGQSGWAAGVTRGKRIELQPLSLLKRRGILETTLRHELAHSFIEVLSRGKAPRWLSEGLAIHFAGEGAALTRVESNSKLTREELERRLSRPASVKEMRELYGAAYKEVSALIQSRGEAGVWQLAAKENAKDAKQTKSATI